MNPLTKFWSLAESQPDSLALVSPNLRMTYGDLGSNVARFAGALAKEKIAKGSVVAVNLRPELEAVVILALGQLGAVSLTYSRIISDNYSSNFDAFITDDALIHTNGKPKIVVDQKFLEELGSVAPIMEPAQLEGDDVIRLVFSSGTTGTPKAIAISAELLPIRTASAFRNWNGETQGMSQLGLDTITGIIALYAAMEYGTTCYLPGTAAETLDLITSHQIRVLETSPWRLGDLVKAAEASNTFFPLKEILVGGSLMPNDLSQRTQERFLVQPEHIYGSSEVGSAAIGIYDPTNPKKVGSVVPDAELQIVDTEDQPISLGHSGRIRYRKTKMVTAYWMANEQSQTGFIDGWFYPGDLGALNSDGSLLLEGRVDDLVNAGGNKFNLQDLDSWLRDSKLFDEVATFTFERLGLTQIGIAFVSANPPIPEMLVSKVQEFLPNLQPSEFIRIGSLPRNKADKVDRKALSALVKDKDA